MIWISIIIEIIQLIPSLIALLQSIFSGMQKLSFAERVHCEHDLHVALMKWYSDRNESDLHASLQALSGSIRASGAPA